MSSYIPVYKKMKYSKQVLIERPLPTKGDLVVKKGDSVVPFTKVGRSKVSKEYVNLASNIHINSKKKEGTFIYKGEQIGKAGFFKKVLAPYNGSLEKVNETWRFVQEKHDAWILSGVWGVVEDVIPGLSVKIKTQSVDINFVAYTTDFVMGELIVFPNPSELLDIEYLNNFSNSRQNKIIYIGHHIRKKIIDTALELNIGCIIGGSITKANFNYAKQNKLPIAVTTGFGFLETPPFIFDFLKTISNRHVFVDGNAGILQIPMPIDNDFKKDSIAHSLREVKAGLSVLILESDYFGSTGVVDDVQDDVIYVKLDKSGKRVSVRIPNIFALI